MTPYARQGDERHAEQGRPLKFHLVPKTRRSESTPRLSLAKDGLLHTFKRGHGRPPSQRGNHMNHAYLARFSELPRRSMSTV